MASANIQQIDTNTPDMDYLLEIYGMSAATQLINKAIELDVFELLYQEKKPVTADELGTKNKFHPARLSRLLNALTALKLVKKSVQGEKVLYCNTRAGELLSKSDPQTFRAMPSWNKMFANFLSSLPKKVKISEEDEKSKKPEEPKECARSEDPGSGHDSDHQHGGEGDHWDTADWPDFFEMYQGFHNFVAPQAKKLVTQYDLSAYKSCMDLGGGTGVLSYELRRQYPEMEVTVFEMDHVVQLVQEKFVPGNEHLNVKFVSGDFFKTPFPTVDLFVICRCLRNMGDKELDDLLSKCFKSLNPGGAILAIEQMQSEARDGSVSATLWDVINMVSDVGIPTPSEYRELFTKHGFTDVAFTFTQDWNEYDIILAKKPK